MKNLLRVLIAGGLCISSVRAANNYWTNPVSAKWESPSWSLGALPASDQAVNIMNDGYKAVNIDSATVEGFASSLIVGSLMVGAPTNAVGALLLNYAGTATPLHVLNDLNLENNGHVVMLYSGLNVGNALNVRSVFDQEGGQLTFDNSSTNTMQIEGGHFNLTNGLVTGANMYLGGTNSGYVNQDSGAVSVASLILGWKPSFPNPSNGTYLLQGGWLAVSDFEGVGQSGFGTLTQNGGTNSASDLFVGNGIYVKSGGALFAGEIHVDAPSGPIFAPPSAIMTHAGGTAIITNDLSLIGQGNRSNPHAATFNMYGGSLSAQRILMEDAGIFVQTNGTVNVANELFVQDTGRVQSSYSLSGGNLFASDTTLSSSYPESATVLQSGGTHIVTNTLWINGTAIYRLGGGTVTASNIVLTGSLSYPPQFFVYNTPSFTVTNQIISMQGGSIAIENSAQQFGRLTINGDSGINFAGNSAILRFADSHTNSWQGQLQGVTPQLTVYNWNGSTNGGGADQLVFGTSSSALTPGQLAQIRFMNPSGFSSGTYPSRILSTGEVVPMAPPTLSSQRNGTSLVISWGGSFILQSATNVVGPYFDVTNATSPYSVNMHQFPMQFFRLRN